MPELERRLAELGRELDLPPAPDLAPGVLAAISAGAGRRRATRPLVVALAVLVLAALATLAVPPARTAVLRFLHLGGVTVERVRTLPTAAERSLAAGLGAQLSPAAAARRVGFRPLVPRATGRVYVRGASVSALLRSRAGELLLLTEFRGDDFGLVKKAASGATRIEFVTLQGKPALWLAGAPHVLLEPRGPRLAGNVLVWQRAGLTLRLEGPVGKREALRIARKLR